MAELGFDPGKRNDAARQVSRSDVHGVLRPAPRMRARVGALLRATGAPTVSEPALLPHTPLVEFSGVIVLFGAPGSGKSSEGELLSKLLGVPHISTGELLRVIAKDDTDLGREVANIMATGRLVSDDLITRVLIDRAQESDCKNGFIIDGFPRRASQIDAFNTMLARMDRKLQAVINLDVEEGVAIQRMTRRSSGRVDDSDPEVLRRRIATFRDDTLPVLDALRATSRVISVVGNGTIEQTHALILPQLPIRDGRWIDSPEHARLGSQS